MRSPFCVPIFSQLYTVDYQINLNGKVDAGLGRVWITLCEWGGWEVWCSWMGCVSEVWSLMFLGLWLLFTLLLSTFVAYLESILERAQGPGKLLLQFWLCSPGFHLITELIENFSSFLRTPKTPILCAYSQDNWSTVGLSQRLLPGECDTIWDVQIDQRERYLQLFLELSCWLCVWWKRNGIVAHKT